MSTILRIELPWGRYHATPWNRSTNEGVAEWPPSPWRILRALFASWKIHRPDLDEHAVMNVLSRLADPPRFHLPAFGEAHTRHYLPGVKHLRGVATDTDKTLDAFIVTDPDASIWVEWDVDLDDHSRQLLEELAAGVRYIGRAETITTCSLSDTPGAGTICVPVDPDSDTSTVGVLVANGPVTIDNLTQTPAGVRNARRLLPRDTRLQRYTTPTPHPDTPRRSPTRPQRPVDTVRISLGGPVLPSRFDTVALGDLLHAAAVKRHRSHSPVLSGKTIDGRPLGGAHLHAHYLPLPEQPILDGRRIASMLIWAPGGFGDSDLDALAELRHLSSHRLDGLRLDTVVTAEGTITDLAPEITARHGASTWVSVTPYSPIRHHPGTVEEQLRSDINLELRHRDMAPVEQVELIQGPWLHYGRYRPGKERIRHQRRAYGLRLHFQDPITGPVVLGQLSHFGLGLFRPDTGP